MNTRLVAITRLPSAQLAECTLTFLERAPIDYTLALEQHAQYRRALAQLGVHVVALPADELPDSMFVEDTALVLAEVAILCSLSPPSRRPEAQRVGEALRKFRSIMSIAAPARLEGGDILPLGRRLFVGRSGRTNDLGIAALHQAFNGFGYEIVPVAISGSLHLKTAITALDEETVLVNPAWLDTAPVSSYRTVEVAPEEPFAANVLSLRGEILVRQNCPRTSDRLDRAGYKTRVMNISEFAKAEGGLTCMSLIFSG